MRFIPRFSFVSPDVAPNFQLDDIGVAVSSIFAPQKALQSRASLVQAWFKSELNVDEVYFTSTCRGGLTLLLESLNLPANSEVLIQGFSCIVVPNAVLQATYRPIVCDVSSDTFNFDLDKIEQRITPKTRVWIIQHNFGIVADMQRVAELCRKHNLILIEDCAHSLGATFTVNGKIYQAGEFGHAACYSFGRDKVISTTTGGASIINDKPGIGTHPIHPEFWQSEFRLKYARLQKMPLSKTLQALLYPILYGLIIKPFYHIGLGKLVAWLSYRFRATGRIYTKEEELAHIEHFPRPQHYSLRLYPLLWNQLKKLTLLNEHRRQLARLYAEKLNLPFNPNSVFMRFPVYLAKLTGTQDVGINKSLYSRIKKAARNKSYFLGSWYTQVFSGSHANTSEVYDYTSQDIPVSETLVQYQVLNLPTNINTSKEDAQRIIDIVTHTIQQSK